MKLELSEKEVKEALLQFVRDKLGCDPLKVKITLKSSLELYTKPVYEITKLETDKDGA